MAPPVSNWNPTNEELVRSWLAFKELHRSGVVIVGCGAHTGYKSYKYWGVEGWYSDEKVIQRMLGDPYDYFIAYNFGVDLMNNTSYHCIHPEELPAILLKMGGRSIDEIVGPAGIATAVEHLGDTLQSNDKYEPKEIPKEAITSMRIHPYMVAGIGVQPWITYSIRDGYAHIERWFGGPESLPMERATIKCSKNIAARIGFGSIKIVAESGEVQEWRKVANLGHVYKVLLRASKGLS